MLRLHSDGGRKHQADTGATEIDGGDTNEKSNGSDNFEINEAAKPDAADFFQVTMASNPGDECPQNQRGYDNFDEAQKNITEKAQVHGEVGAIQSEFKAGEHGKEDPESQRTAFHARNGKDCDSAPADYRQGHRMTVKEKR